ncbi:MAG: STAS domain-containing protein [Thermodesulfobacteriota bacterium]
MEIDTKEKNEIRILSVQGSIDADTASEFDQSLEKHISTGRDKIILDLSRLEYISSAGLRVIMKAAKKMEITGGEMAIVGLRGVVQEVFKVSGFYSLFNIYDSEEEAVLAT